MERYFEISGYNERSNQTIWPDFDLSTWPVFSVTSIPRQKDLSSCGLFMLKCMEHWNGSKLTTKFKQGDIDIFRRKLAAILVGSTSNDNTDIPTYNK
uniref:Ubiquitin-like protease family profile domain-containing protein n=1 Tax=Oryza rufipogon TaxID=4529 RepID=A0A0E0MXA5_ORYRU